MQFLHKFIPIKQRYQFLGFVISWFVCYEVLTHVLNANFEAGLYPPESDSLAIPIFTNFFLGIFLGLSCLIGVALPKTKIWGLISIATFSMCSLISAVSILEWLVPNHYWIAVGHLLPAAVCLYMLLSSVKLRALKIATSSDKHED
jgi:uncharacterized membrane protein